VFCDFPRILVALGTDADGIARAEEAAASVLAAPQRRHFVRGFRLNVVSVVPAGLRGTVAFGVNLWEIPTGLFL
jgi:hypothetical protein